jgi:hypothetical protein
MDVGSYRNYYLDLLIAVDTYIGILGPQRRDLGQRDEK